MNLIFVCLQHPRRDFKESLEQKELQMVYNRRHWHPLQRRYLL